MTGLRSPDVTRRKDKPKWSELPNLPPPEKLARTAKFSACGRYRWTLDRCWDLDPIRINVLYIGLNPSTADATKDDATTTRNIRRLRSIFAGQMGAYRAVNVFAYRSPRPAALWCCKDPIGRENDAWLIRSIDWADQILVGWGNGGRRLGRDQVVRCMLRDTDAPVYCLGYTKCGQPRHPLYIAYERRWELFIDRWPQPAL